MLLGHAVAQPGERALDLACGTGAVARHIAPLVGAEGRVVAFDINSEMLADWSMYLKAVETWEEPGPQTRSVLRTVSTSRSVEDAVLHAAKVLRLWGLCG
jgi:SAM-dependent methyltransferase